MDAIEGSGFQGNDQFSQIRTTVEELPEMLRQFYCARLIVCHGECLKGLLGFKIQKSDNIAS